MKEQLSCIRSDAVSGWWGYLVRLVCVRQNSTSWRHCVRSTEPLLTDSEYFCETTPPLDVLCRRKNNVSILILSIKLKSRTNLSWFRLGLEHCNLFDETTRNKTASTVNLQQFVYAFENTWSRDVIMHVNAPCRRSSRRCVDRRTPWWCHPC